MQAAVESTKKVLIAEDDNWMREMLGCLLDPLHPLLDQPVPSDSER
jgi:hypothetical protein